MMLDWGRATIVGLLIAAGAGLYKAVPRLLGWIIEARYGRELGQLRDEVRRLKEDLADRGDLRSDRNGMWRQQPDRKPDGPFCRTCWEADAKTILLQVRRVSAEYELGSCPACKTKVWLTEDGEGPPPRERPPRIPGRFGSGWVNSWRDR